MNDLELADVLFNHLLEGVLVVDEAGAICRASTSVEDLFGYSVDELIGQKVEMLIPDRFKSIHQNHREAFHRNPESRSMNNAGVLFGRKKSGDEVSLQISLTPYSSTFGFFVFLFIVEITERIKIEEALRELSSQLEKRVLDRTLILEEAIEQLEKTKVELHHALTKEHEINELKSRFVSNASHEFRTPLATVLSSLALIERYGESSQFEKQYKHISRIKASVSTLTDILDDILSLTKLEEGAVRSNAAEVDIVALVGSFLEEFRLLAKPELTISHHHSGGETAMVDPKLLRIVLNNLISNSVKFSAVGQPIVINTEVSEESLMVAVQDQGMGIPLVDQPHLFGRFFRAQNALHVTGTGLGLNIVSRCVELMMGTIDLSSIENVGTTITVTLPR